MIGDHEDVDNNSKKLTKLDERLSSYLRDGLNVLDVGAGEAWAMAYFQERNCNYFAIEAAERLASLIQKRGGKVIGKSIFDSYPEYESRFDIIIFRHILEHLLDPRRGLLAIRNLLNADGLIYLALPNASNPSAHHKGFRTSFVRPVHVSYFCEGNVLRLAHSVGLAPVRSEALAEIFCLLKHGSSQSFENVNYYAKQKEVFSIRRRQTVLQDSVNVIRDLPKALVKRLLRKT
jgi:SAM-dependent methyltransferase